MEIETHGDRKWLIAGDLRVALDKIVAVRSGRDGLHLALWGGSELALDESAKPLEWFKAEADWLLAAYGGDYLALTKPSPGHPVDWEE